MTGHQTREDGRRRRIRTLLPEPPPVDFLGPQKTAEPWEGWDVPGQLALDDDDDAHATGL